MYKQIIATLIIIISFSIVSAELILPAQTNTIKLLAVEYGFSDENLDQYLIKNYGTTVLGLSRYQAIQIIKHFRSENPPKPLKQSYIKPIEETKELLIAESLEVGMSKRFYMVDGNVIDGKIISIENSICAIETVDGKLDIPVNEILEETVDLLKKEGARYKGPLISETLEELVIKSKYGEVTIQKRNIKDLDRYQGGRLVPKTEMTKKFYQGEAQLISVFLDPTAFILEPNTFYLSGLSVGYGLTDRFMLTTEFASNFAGDLNLHPRLRLSHKKTADTEKSFTIGLGIHRSFPMSSIVSKYSHHINVYIDSISTESLVDTGNEETTLNFIGMDYNIIGSDGERSARISDITDNAKGVYAEFYTVYSSRRKNPTGRGKVGWSVGCKFSNAFMVLDKINNGGLTDVDNPETKYLYEWKEDRGAIAYRSWASFEYDLRKNLKFVGSMWMDNGSKRIELRDIIEDFTGNGSSSGLPFIFDSPEGDATPFDFDFGLLYAVNENFRIGVHFQQPYIDIYWKFFEF
jgi:hypothetical protein